MINFNIVKEKLMRPDEDKNGCCLYFHYIEVFFVNFGGSQIVNQKQANKKPSPLPNLTPFPLHNTCHSAPCDNFLHRDQTSSNY